jgi:pyridinium-3,5-bisthiocarboxylic acid mononucleotide nickel chelatase
MKKNRPGTLLTILARPEHEVRLRALLFRESSTLGIRTRHEQRYALPRRHETVTTPWGEVRMKVASLNGTVSQYAPEYEDCRRIAAAYHLPLKTVMQEAIRLYLDRQHG